MKKLSSVILALFVLAFPSSSFGEDPEVLKGKVQFIEKYGNIDLDIKASELFGASYEPGDMVQVLMNGKTYEMPIGTEFSDVDQGSMICKADLDEERGVDLVMLAINMGSMAKETGIAQKVKTDRSPGYRWEYEDTVILPLLVQISMKEKAGYKDMWLIHQLQKTNDRQDYPSLTDKEFANFRSISTTGMGHGILYRSSSPINPSLGRNSFADRAMEAAQIKTAVNLADSGETMKSIGFGVVYEGYLKTYYSKTNIIPLNLGVDFRTKNFRAGLKKGLQFMIENEGPYLVHCNEGKSRTGFVSAVLESLMGASSKEIILDYMTTFKNYYGVTEEKDHEKYEAIVNSNIKNFLKTAFSIDDMEDPAVDLAKEAEEYLLKDLGLTKQELASLKSNLAKSVKIESEVAEIDKYGDLILTLKASALDGMGFECGDVVAAEINGKIWEMPVGTNYSDVDSGSQVCIIRLDSEKGRDYVELAISAGNLAEKSGIAVREKTEKAPGYRWKFRRKISLPVKVEISMKEKAGYKDGYLVHQLKRTDSRDDYKGLTDWEFANFRPVSTTGMGHRVLYRSSSPVNPEIGRNSYADKAMAEAGIKSVVNLADSPSVMEGYIDYGKTYYSKAKVTALNLGVDFSSDEFKKGLKEAFLFIGASEGPYLIHCNEGKDRAGFVSGLLESLMGASLEEITSDYMATYRNYYGVLKNTEQYDIIGRSNIQKRLAEAFGLKDIALESVDLAKEAEEYLKKDLGLTEAETANLKSRLRKDMDSALKVPVSGLEKYGHIDLAVSTEDLLKRYDYGDVIEAQVNGHTFTLPLCSDYTDVKAGEYLIRAAKGKPHVGLAINYGKICEEAGICVKEGDKYVFAESAAKPLEASLTLKEKAGYLLEWESHHLERTDSRDDYKDLTDSQFANFRPITSRGIQRGILYRSSSPINPEIRRNLYSDKAMEKSGIKSVLNLADTEETARSYEGFEDSYYSKQNNLYLGLDVNFNSDGFRSGLRKGLLFMIENEGPYLIHCTEGKDRAGFVSAVLESLMGASLQEVIGDYMTSFYNYYGVKPGDKKYGIIARDNIVTNLSIAFGVPDITSPEVDLAKEAHEYVKSLGLTESDLEALKARLSSGMSMDKAA